MKSAAPLPPGFNKNGLNENTSNLMSNQSIIFINDAIVYVLKERTWSPVTESFSKVCLIQTEPKMYKVIVMEMQNMVLQSVIDAFVNVKLKDTFVKWKSEKTTIGVRFTNKDTAYLFYQHIENIVGKLTINEKKSFYLNVTLPSGKVQQIKVFLGMKLNLILENICSSADLDPDKYRLVDLNEPMVAKIGFITEEFSNKSFKVVNVRDSLKKQNSIGSQNSNSSASDDYPTELYINLEDSNWIGFFNITNILKSELNNYRIQDLILSFVKERGGYSYLRMVNGHKISHDVIDDLNNLAGQVHAINDRSEVNRNVSNSVDSSSVEYGLKTSKRPAPPPPVEAPATPPPETKDLIKSKAISEYTLSNIAKDMASQKCTSPKLLNKNKRHAPSVPSSPAASIKSVSSNKNLEAAKDSEIDVKSITSPIPPIRIINSNKNIEPVKTTETVVKSISSSPVPAIRFMNSNKNVESTKNIEAVVKSAPSSPVTSVRSINSNENIEPLKTKKISEEGDKPPPLFVPPPPPQEPPPDDYSSPEDETPLLNSSILKQVETYNACVGSKDDHNFDCVSNSDANDTEKDVSVISDEIYDLVPTQSNTKNDSDISFESEILSEIAEVSEISDSDDDLTCYTCKTAVIPDATTDQFHIESKNGLVLHGSNMHQQNAENKDMRVVLKKEENSSESENSGKSTRQETESSACSTDISRSIDKNKNISSALKKPPSGLYSLLKKKAVGPDVNQSICLDNVDGDIEKLSAFNIKAISSSECDLEKKNISDSVRLNNKEVKHIVNQVNQVDVRQLNISNVELNEVRVKPTEISEKNCTNIENFQGTDKNKIILKSPDRHDSSQHYSSQHDSSHRAPDQHGFRQHDFSCHNSNQHDSIRLDSSQHDFSHCVSGRHDSIQHDSSHHDCSQHGSSHHDSSNCKIECAKTPYENLSHSSNVISQNCDNPDQNENIVFLKTNNQTPANLLNADDDTPGLGSGFQFEINKRLDSLAYKELESVKVLNHAEIDVLDPGLCSKIDVPTANQNYNVVDPGLCSKIDVPTANQNYNNVLDPGLCSKIDVPTANQNYNNVLDPGLCSKIDVPTANQNYNKESFKEYLIDNEIQTKNKSKNSKQENKDKLDEQKCNLQFENLVSISYDPDSLVIFPDEQVEKKLTIKNEKNQFDPDKVVIFPDQIPKDTQPPIGVNPWRIHGSPYKSTYSKALSSSPLSRDSSINKSSEIINTDILRSVGAEVMALDEKDNNFGKDLKINDLRKSLRFEKEIISETKPKSTDNFPNNQKNSFLFNRTLSQEGSTNSLLDTSPKLEENIGFISYTKNPQQLNDSKKIEPVKDQISITKNFKSSIKNQTFDLRSKDQEVIEKKVPPKTLPKRKISNDSSIRLLELRQTNDSNVRPSEPGQISNENNVKPSELARISQLLSSKN